LANAKINVVLITQASSLHTMCVAIEEGVAQKAGAAVDAEFAYEISLGKVNPVVVEKGFSIVSLVGDDMKNQSGTGGKMFKALGDSGINIRAIAQGSSERNISTIIHSKDYEESVRVIHNKFFETKSPRKAYLFIAGYGTVGKELVQLIHSRRESLLSQRSIDLVIAGICSSSKMVLDRKGISPEKAQSLYSNGGDGGINQFVREILHEQPGRTIFADCTASGNVASLYRELLDNGVSIVTCNKIAPSSPLTAWDALKETAKSKSLSLLYETTAGAALPVVETIERLIESGEEVTEVQAILSGTLNYLFSNYDGTKPFGILLQEAKELGYTEPDPSIDLSGVDVLRKSTIIARECGFKVEQKEIESTPAAPSGIFEGDPSKFIDRVLRAEEYFLQIYHEALQQGKRLRYTAKITSQKCSTGIEAVSPDNPLYHVEGTNNSVTIRTNNYPMGITITGAGAGARVTAGGVLNDILKASL
jgi:aspartokinase/homoserine dehydrogenase 1